MRGWRSVVVDLCVFWEGGPISARSASECIRLISGGTPAGGNTDRRAGYCRPVSAAGRLEPALLALQTRRDVACVPPALPVHRRTCYGRHGRRPWHTNHPLPDVRTAGQVSSDDCSAGRGSSRLGAQVCPVMRGLSSSRTEYMLALGASMPPCCYSCGFASPTSITTRLNLPSKANGTE